MVSAEVYSVFVALVLLIISGIFGSFCFIGFDAKSQFDIIVDKWKQAKQEKRETDIETTYFSGFLSAIVNLVLIFGLVLGSVSLLKITAIKKAPKMEDFVDIVITSLISVFVAVGLTMAAVRMLPIFGRAFENTVGYAAISLFGGLEPIADSIFTSSSESKIKYGVLATKMFDTGFFSFLDKMKNAQSSPIQGIMLKKDVLDFSGDLKLENEETNPVYQLFKLVALKHSISEATIVSLASIVAMFAGFVMIQYSGIRKKL